MTYPPIYYRFRCACCAFTKETQDRASIPEYCPSCGYPRDARGHVYRAEPQDGEALDA